MDSLFGLDRISPHDDSLELLTTVFDSAQQMIVESILRDAEIPYLVKSRGAGTAVKVITGFSKPSVSNTMISLLPVFSRGAGT